MRLYPTTRLCLNGYSLSLANYLSTSCTHSELKTWLFGKSFPPWTCFAPTGLIPRTLGPFDVFIFSTADLCAWCVRLSRFSNALKICVISFTHSLIHSMGMFFTYDFIYRLTTWCGENIMRLVRNSFVFQ